jgi:ketosteroid isomerase-like protein
LFEECDILPIRLKIKIMEIPKKSKEVVLSFLEALNQEDFKKAKECLNNDFIFRGPMGERNGAGEYIEDMKKMKFKYQIDKAFSEDEDVCIIYEIDMSGKAKIPTSGLYHLGNGRISSLKVFFDPRPILKK